MKIKWLRFSLLLVLSALIFSLPSFAEEVTVEVTEESVWTWIFLTYGILKLGQRLDVIMNSLGIHVGLQGGNPFDEIIKSASSAKMLFGGGKHGSSGAAGEKIMSKGTGFWNGGLIGAGMRAADSYALRNLVSDAGDQFDNAGSVGGKLASLMKNGYGTTASVRNASASYIKGLTSSRGSKAFETSANRAAQIINGDAGSKAVMSGSNAQATAEAFLSGGGMKVQEAFVQEGAITGVTDDGRQFGLFDADKYEMPVGTTYDLSAKSERVFDPNKDTIKIGNKRMYQVVQCDPKKVTDDEGNTRTEPQQLAKPRKMV